MLSIIIPTYNEEDNLASLVDRLAQSLIGLAHELIFVDDHSTDGTAKFLRALKSKYPREHIRLLTKQGARGKATSLLEGIVESKGEIIAMIDADLQYPPEAIPQMVLQLTDADIVVGNRQFADAGNFRKISSKIYKFFFGRMLLGLPYDVQSGLKVFRKQVCASVRLKPSAWGFDYDFLFKAKRLGWRIAQTDIQFTGRMHGKSNVSVLSTGLELGFGALKLRFKYFLFGILKFLEYPHPSERLGNNWNNNWDFVYTPQIMSAKRTLYLETVSLVLTILFVLSATIYGLHRLTGISSLVIISGIMAVFYVVMMAFKLRVIYHATTQKFLDISPEEIESVNPYDLPMYTILVPLYKEAAVIRQIITAMSAIDYPTEKLEIIITLEEYDTETIEAIADANPPAHFRTLILPDVQPKTKPKALNVAFPQVHGEFLVIYDAEIIPDADQLKKAYLAFQKFPQVDALQTRLDHYNPEQSLITRLFNEEFAFHFDMLLPGLQKLGYPIPLSGHSVHFRKSALEDIGAWDPYNVTEDADTGIKLARAGKKVEILDSVSREEATTSIYPWVAQRTRWIKGFIQTSIVHLRHPLRFKREVGIGWAGLFAFAITVPASVVINIANLVYWGLLVGWFATHSHLIQSLFPSPIFYTSLISFAAGNIIFVYLNLVSSYQRGRYNAVKYGLLSPLYWILLAVASVRAAAEFMYSPHHWSKTVHGKHLAAKEETLETYAIKLPQTET
ncbi:MAG TPA: glycosyltransferase [Patescibacteria group bacterium]|nr:glycosyltransferase [Patescibacteria group bacterium]